MCLFVLQIVDVSNPLKFTKCMREQLSFCHLNDGCRKTAKESLKHIRNRDLIAFDVILCLFSTDISSKSKIIKLNEREDIKSIMLLMFTLQFAMRTFYFLRKNFKFKKTIFLAYDCEKIINFYPNVFKLLKIYKCFTLFSLSLSLSLYSNHQNHCKYV